MALSHSDTIDIGGSVDIDLGGDGIVRRPKFAGEIDLRNVRYGPEPRSPWFTDLRGAIRLGKGAIRADSITANVGKVPILAAVDIERGDSSRFTASLHVSRDSSLLLSGTAGFTADSIDVVVESRDLELAVVQPFVEDLR